MEKVSFGNLSLAVPEGVFRPRVETEFWIKKVVPFLKKKQKPLLVIDIFCGTGCLGLFVLKNVEKTKVLFLDSEEKCLKVVLKNADLNNIERERFKVKRSYFFEKAKGEYDFILANPPYVAEQRRNEVSPDVLKKDPREALFSGKRGTKAIRVFLKKVPFYLKKRGEVFMEFDPFQKEEIEKILREKGFSYSFEKDQFQKLRWFRASFDQN